MNTALPASGPRVFARSVMMKECFPASLLVVAALLRVAGASRNEPWSGRTTIRSSWEEGLVAATGHLVPVREDDAAQATLQLDSFTSDLPPDGISQSLEIIRMETEAVSKDEGQPMRFPSRRTRRSELSFSEGAAFGHQREAPSSRRSLVSRSILSHLSKTETKPASQPEPLVSFRPREDGTNDAPGHDLSMSGEQPSLVPVMAAERDLLATPRPEPLENAGPRVPMGSSPSLATSPVDLLKFTLGKVTAESQAVLGEAKSTPAKGGLGKLLTFLATGSQELPLTSPHLELRTSETPRAPEFLAEAQLHNSHPSQQRPLLEERTTVQQPDFDSSPHGKTKRQKAGGLGTVENTALPTPSGSHAHPFPLLSTPETPFSRTRPQCAMPRDASHSSLPKSLFPSLTLQPETDPQVTTRASHFSLSQATATLRDSLSVSEVQETPLETSVSAQGQPQLSSLLVPVYGKARRKVPGTSPLVKAASSSHVQLPLPVMRDAAGLVTRGIDGTQLFSTFLLLVQRQGPPLSTPAPSLAQPFALPSASFPAQPPTPGISAAVSAGLVSLGALASSHTVLRHESERLLAGTAASVQSTSPAPGISASAPAGPESSAATDFAHPTPSPAGLSTLVCGELGRRTSGMPFQVRHQRPGSSVSTHSRLTVPETTGPSHTEAGTAGSGLNASGTAFLDFTKPKPSPNVSSPSYAVTQTPPIRVYPKLKPATPSTPAPGPQEPVLGVTMPAHVKLQEPGAPASFIEEPQLAITPVHGRATLKTNEALVEGNLPVSSEANVSIPTDAKAPLILSVHAQTQHHPTCASTQLGARPLTHSGTKTTNMLASSADQLLGHPRPPSPNASVFVQAELHPQGGPTFSKNAAWNPKVLTGDHLNRQLPTTLVLPGMLHTTAEEKEGKGPQQSSLPAPQPGISSTPLRGVSASVPSPRAEGRDRSSGTPSLGSPVPQTAHHRTAPILSMREHFPGLRTTLVLAAAGAQGIVQSSRGFILHLLNQLDITEAGNRESAVASSYLGILSAVPHLSFLIRSAENTICLQPVQNHTPPSPEPNVSGQEVASFLEMLVSSTFLGLSHLGASSLIQANPSSVFLIKPMFVFLPDDEPEDAVLPSAEEETEHADGHLFTKAAVLDLVVSSHKQLAESNHTIGQTTRANSFPTNRQAISGTILHSLPENATRSNLVRSTMLKVNPFHDWLREVATNKTKSLLSKGQEEGLRLSILDPPQSRENNTVTLSVEHHISSIQPMAVSVHQRPTTLPSTTEFPSSPPRMTSLHSVVKHSTPQMLARTSKSEDKPQPNTIPPVVVSVHQSPRTLPSTTEFPSSPPRMTSLHSVVKHSASQLLARTSRSEDKPQSKSIPSTAEPRTLPSTTQFPSSPPRMTSLHSVIEHSASQMLAGTSRSEDKPQPNTIPPMVVSVHQSPRTLPSTTEFPSSPPRMTSLHSVVKHSSSQMLARTSQSEDKPQPNTIPSTAEPRILPSTTQFPRSPPRITSLHSVIEHCASQMLAGTSRSEDKPQPNTIPPVALSVHQSPRTLPSTTEFPSSPPRMTSLHSVVKHSASQMLARTSQSEDKSQPNTIPPVVVSVHQSPRALPSTTEFPSSPPRMTSLHSVVKHSASQLLARTSQSEDKPKPNTIPPVALSVHQSPRTLPSTTEFPSSPPRMTSLHSVVKHSSSQMLARTSQSEDKPQPNTIPPVALSVHQSPRTLPSTTEFPSSPPRMTSLHSVVKHSSSQMLARTSQSEGKPQLNTIPPVALSVHQSPRTLPSTTEFPSSPPRMTSLHSVVKHSSSHMLARTSQSEDKPQPNTIPPVALSVHQSPRTLPSTTEFPSSPPRMTSLHSVVKHSSSQMLARTSQSEDKPQPNTIPPVALSVHQSPRTLPSTTEFPSSPPRMTSLHSVVKHSSSQMLARTSQSEDKPQPNTIPPVALSVHQSPRTLPSTTEFPSSPPRMTSLHSVVKHSSSQMLARTSQSEDKPQPNTIPPVALSVHQSPRTLPSTTEFPSSPPRMTSLHSAVKHSSSQMLARTSQSEDKPQPNTIPPVALSVHQSPRTLPSTTEFPSSPPRMTSLHTVVKHSASQMVARTSQSEDKSQPNAIPPVVVSVHQSPRTLPSTTEFPSSPPRMTSLHSVVKHSASQLLARTSQSEDKSQPNTIPPVAFSVHQSPRTLPSTTEFPSSPPRMTSLHSVVKHSASQMLARASRSEDKPQPNTIPPVVVSVHQSPRALPSTTQFPSSPPRMTSLHSVVKHSAFQMLEGTSQSEDKPQPNTIPTTAEPWILLSATAFSNFPPRITSMPSVVEPSASQMLARASRSEDKPQLNTIPPMAASVHQSPRTLPSMTQFPSSPPRRTSLHSLVKLSASQMLARISRSEDKPQLNNIPPTSEPRILPSTTQFPSSPRRITSLHSVVEHSAAQMLATTSRSVDKPQPNTIFMLHAENHHPGSTTSTTSRSKNFVESLSTSSVGNMDLPLEVAKHLTPSRAVSHSFLITKVFRKRPSESQHLLSTVSNFLTFSTVKNLSVSAAVNYPYSEAVTALPKVRETSSYFMDATLAKVSTSRLFSPKPSQVSERPRPPSLTTPFLAYPQAHTALSEKHPGELSLRVCSRPSASLPSQVSTHVYFATSALKYHQSSLMLPGRASLISAEEQTGPTASNEESGMNVRGSEMYKPTEAVHLMPTVLGTESTLLVSTEFSSALASSGGTVGSTDFQSELPKPLMTTLHLLSPSSSRKDTTAAPMGGGMPPLETPYSDLPRLQVGVTAETNKMVFFSPSPVKEELIQNGRGLKAVAAPFFTSSHIHLWPARLESGHQDRANLLEYEQAQDSVSSMPSPGSTSLGSSAVADAPTLLETRLSSEVPTDGPVEKVLNQSSRLQSLPLDPSKTTLALHTQVLFTLESLSDRPEITTEGHFTVEATSTGELDESYLYTMGEQVTIVRDTTEEAAKDPLAASQLSDSNSSLLNGKMHHRRLSRSEDVFLDGFAIVSDDTCSSGNYSAEMSLRHAVGPPPSRPDTFLVLIVLLGNSSRPSLRIKSCCVTPTARPAGPDAACCHFPRSPLECRYIQLHQKSRPQTASFTIQLFQMLNRSVAYLHCELSICLRNHAGCEQSCSENRETRAKPSGWSSYQTLHNLISLGPVLKAQPEFPSEFAAGSEPAMMSPVLLSFLAGIAVLPGISVFIWLHQRHTTRRAEDLEGQKLRAP